MDYLKYLYSGHNDFRTARVHSNGDDKLTYKSLWYSQKFYSPLILADSYEEMFWKLVDNEFISLTSTRFLEALNGIPNYIIKKLNLKDQESIEDVFKNNKERLFTLFNEFDWIIFISEASPFRYSEFYVKEDIPKQENTRDYLENCWSSTFEADPSRSDIWGEWFDAPELDGIKIDCDYNDLLSLAIKNNEPLEFLTQYFEGWNLDLEAVKKADYPYDFICEELEKFGSKWFIEKDIQQAIIDRFYETDYYYDYILDKAEEEYLDIIEQTYSLEHATQSY